MCEIKIQQDFIAKEKQDKVLREKVPKIGVEHIKGNKKVNLYIYTH
jgi:hypothetical protein